MPRRFIALDFFAFPLTVFLQTGRHPRAKGKMEQNMKRTSSVTVAAILLVAGLCGCTSIRQQTAEAVAVLNPTQGSIAQGTIYFSRATDGVRLDGEITGLKPGRHGFHIHERGDCSAPDAASAGGHFNPTGMPHAAPYEVKRHMGDLGNIVADASGIAKFSQVDHAAKLEGPNSIIGHAVIIHADPDDFKTQPAGNAGKRVACGVIVKQ